MAAHDTLLNAEKENENIDMHLPFISECFENNAVRANSVSSESPSSNFN